MTLEATPAGPIPVQPYVSDGQFSANSLLMLATGMLIVGAILGVAAHFVEQIFWLILVFPIGIGFLLGMAGIKMVKLWHVRSPMIGAVVGLVGGVTAMLCMHYAGYLHYRNEIEKNESIQQIMAMSPADQAEVVAGSKEPMQTQYLIDSLHNFKGYMDFVAYKGVEISNHGGTPMNLGYWGSYIYWLVEIGIVAAVSLGVLKAECGKPYCAACGAWKKETTLGGLDSDSNQAAAALSAGDLAILKTCGPSQQLTNLMLYAASCPVCNGAQSPTDLRLVKFVPQAKGKAKQEVVKFVTIPTAFVPSVCELFLPPLPAVATPLPPTPPTTA